MLLVVPVVRHLARQAVEHVEREEGEHERFEGPRAALVDDAPLVVARDALEVALPVRHVQLLAHDGWQLCTALPHQAAYSEEARPDRAPQAYVRTAVEGKGAKGMLLAHSVLSVGAVRHKQELQARDL